MFDPPEPEKNLKKCCNVITFRGFRDSVHCAVGHPKSTQSTPQLSQKASRGKKKQFKTGPHFSIAFLTIFSSQNGAQNRPPNQSKIDLGAPGPPGSLRGAPQGLPEAARETFWNHSGPMLALPAPLAYHLGRSCRARVPQDCRKHRSKSLFKRSFRNL